MLNDAAVSQFKKIYLAPGYTDLRRGIDGLASSVRFQFELDPYDKNAEIKKVQNISCQWITAGILYLSTKGQLELFLSRTGFADAVDKTSGKP